MFPNIGGKPPKWMLGKFHGSKPLLKQMDDLGGGFKPPIFGWKHTPIGSGKFHPGSFPG